MRQRGVLSVTLRRLHVVALPLAAFVVAVPASQAGSVGVSVSSPNAVTFVARSGETNALNVDIFNPGGFVFTDFGAGMTAGAGCVSLGQNSADCDYRANIDAYLGNKDDTAWVVWDGILRVWAGNGDDRVLASSYGGYAVAYGEAGDDVVSVVGEGGQLADGGPGDDEVNVFAYGGESTGIGGNGQDIIEFRHATTANDGPVVLDGGNGADTISMQPLRGGGGTATGGLGDDMIVVTPNPDPRSGDGPGSTYTLSGGQGDDSLIGGASIDAVDGGAGRDFIDVRGGGADTVTCGPGKDIVLYDTSDVVSGDCETSSTS